MTEFPLVSLKGGPVGSSARLEIDGKLVTAAVDVVIEATVGDAIKTTVRRITKVDVEVRSQTVDGPPVFEVTVRYPAEIDAERLAISGIVARSKADTPWGALYDCGRHLELEAARRVARDGTI